MLIPETRALFCLSIIVIKSFMSVYTSETSIVCTLLLKQTTDIKFMCVCCNDPPGVHTLLYDPAMPGV